MTTKNEHPLITELNEFRSQFQAKAKTALSLEFKNFFKKYPEIEAIKWSQYTPYFNDGEPCEFGVGDVTVHARYEEVGTAREPAKKIVGVFEPDVVAKLEEVLGKDDYYSDVLNVISSLTYSGFHHTMDRRGKTDFEVQLELDANLLESLIQGLHDMMKDIFDDHVIVTANRGGFDVEEYQHD